MPKLGFRFIRNSAPVRASSQAIHLLNDEIQFSADRAVVFKQFACRGNMARKTDKLLIDADFICEQCNFRCKARPVDFRFGEQAFNAFVKLFSLFFNDKRGALRDFFANIRNHAESCFHVG